MADNIQNNKRLSRNIMFLYFRLFIVLFVHLLISRVLLNALGVEDYGIYNVVAGFVLLFGFLNSTLTTSTQRFYNYEGATKGVVGFQNVYVIAILTHAIISIVLIVILETFGLWYVNNIMVIPSDRLYAANVLFQTSILSMVLMIMKTPYSGAVLAKECMDFYAIASLVDVILKLLVASAISWTRFDNLIVYGILLSMVSVIDTLMFLGYCKKKFIEIRFRRYFDNALFKSMFAFSSWNLIGTFAFTMKGQGVNMLLNYFFGPLINAARGVAYQVNGAIHSFSSNIYIAFSPQIVKSYANGEYERTRKMMFMESKVCFSLIAILMTPAIIEMKYLLHLWLGDEVPDHTVIFSILVLIDTLVCTLNAPCTQVVYATGNIKKYQMRTSIIHLCLLPFSWLLLKLGCAAESTFLLVIICSCINQTVSIYQVNKQFHIGLKKYLREIILRCLAICLLLPIIPLIISNIMPSSFLRLVILGVSSMIYSLLIIYFVMFNGSEQEIIDNIIRTKVISKIKGK